MKKLILMLLAALSISCVWALSGGSGQGYDPSNPPDPNAAYRLTVETAPAKLGGTDPSGTSKRSFGDRIYISAPQRVGYDFRCWMEGEEVVSEYPGFEFEMPARNVTLTAWYDRNTHYDPANPGDPFFDGYTHRVNVYRTPSSGGDVNQSNFLLKEGEQTELYAYPHSDYKFSCWKQDGKIISVDPSLRITMGTKDLAYTAQFVYNPASPADPGTNSWNPALGELVVDDFSRGSLWYAISHLTGDDFDAVNKITVIGEIDDYDLNCLSNLRNITEADFSRTFGATSVSYWTFGDNTALTRLLLPASINYIDNSAFRFCVNLSELCCYAAMPPQVWGETFEGVPSTMIVKVYSSSLDLYQNSDVWRNYRLLTLDEESTALTVSLPEAADYEHSVLQLSNLSTGEKRRLVVTPTRTRYIFGNLIAGDKYTLAAIAPGGQTVGQYADFEIPEKGLEYAFESLTPLMDVTLDIVSVTMEGSSPVEEPVQVNWYDSDHAFLASGMTLKGLVPSQKVYYEIIPSSEFCLAYMLPELEGSHIAGANGNQITRHVNPIERHMVTGIVYSLDDNRLLGGALVILDQDINGQPVSQGVRADGDGKFSMEVADFPGTYTVSYIDHYETIVPFPGVDRHYNVKIGLRMFSGYHIDLKFYTAENVESGGSHVFKPYEEGYNVDLKIRDITNGADINDFRLRYNDELTLIGVEAEDQTVSILATPRDETLNGDRATKVLTYEKGEDVPFRFLHDGDLIASFKGVKPEAAVALLYDASGSLVKSAGIPESGVVSFPSLPEGRYTVVGIKDATVFTSAGTLAELRASYLEENLHYVTLDTSVADGYISRLSLDAVPDFDESAFAFTGRETLLALNKSAVTAGQTVTVRANVDLLPEYADRVDRVTLAFTLPEGVEYVPKSLLIPERGVTPATIDGRRLTVETSLSEASARFCVTGAKGGDWRISGSVEFMLDGDRICQPFGSQLLSVTDFSLSAPDYTYVPGVTVRGYATPLSEVRVYDNDVPVGRARSLTNGEWRLSFDLTDIVPDQRSDHRIYADITAADGARYTTSVATTVYDPDWAMLTDVLMINGGTCVDFDHVATTSSPGSYTYWLGTDMFTFKAIFRDGAAKEVKGLDFVIYLSDGSLKIMDSKYLPSQDAWVCAVGFDDINRLPVNVEVVYSTDKANPIADKRHVARASSLRCPDVTPVIDPSGFVYEAVASNRLEGVQATIFYKEWAEDMYGDVYEKVIRWDAEAYAQRNPLFTDADGMYQWDVPSGEWQVRFEKQGYEAAATEWLPVPPPQLDVNVSMIRLEAPHVQEVKAYEQAVEVTFDKYMDPARFTDVNVVVSVDGTTVEGSLIPVGEETAPSGAVYATGLRFEASAPFASDAVSVSLASRLCSYAGVPMESVFTQEFDVEPEISSISLPAEAEAYVGEELLLHVSVLPGEAAAGKKLVAELSSPIAVVDEETVVNENGEAIIRVRGELPGAVKLSVSVEGSKVAPAEAVLSFEVAPDPCDAPVSSVKEDVLLTPDVEIVLSSPTPDARILYTLDGSDPATSSSAMEYLEPIRWLDLTDMEDMRILAIARADNHMDSPVAEFVYKKDISLGVASVCDGEALGEYADGRLSVNTDCLVSLFDMEGKTLMAERLMRTGDTLDLCRQAPGIYIILLKDSDRRQSMRIRI